MLDFMRKHASSWLVKVIFGLIIVVFVAWGVNFSATDDKVIAYVNEEPITVREFGRAYEQSLQQVREQNPDISSEALQQAGFKKSVLGRLINTMIMEQEAEKLGLTVSAREVRHLIRNIPAFQNEEQRFDYKLYEARLARQGQSAPQFEASMREDFMIQRLIDYIGLPGRVTERKARQLFNYLRQKAVVDYAVFRTEAFLDQVSASEEEIQEIYTNNQDRFRQPARIQIRYLAFTPEDLAAYETVPEEDVEAYYASHQEKFKHPESLKVRHILIKVDQDASEDKEQQARRRAEKLLSRIKVGEDFAELAEKHSDGPSADQGGDLDWMTRGQMVEPFEAAAFDLETGEVSEPVRTRFGWHLIKVDERKPAGVHPLEEVREEIHDLLAEEQASAKVTDLLDEAMAQAAAGASLDEIAQNLDLQIKESELSSLKTIRNAFGMTKEAVEMLFNRPVGMIADMPLAIENGYLLAEKVQEKPASVLPLDKVKDNVEQMIKTDKAKKLARRQAQQALDKLTEQENSSPAAVLDTGLTTSEPFGRRGFIPTLGKSPQLASAAFDAEPGRWLPKPYEVAAGYVVARLDHRIPAPDEEWKKQKERWMQTLTNQQQQDIVGAFLQQVRSETTVEVVQPDMLK
jgi:peptidyl-prolyl cis-trans isomerase D